MTQANLVSRYLSAWNDHDVDAVLDLMHSGAAIYNAFWQESCVGKNLRQYLEDRFEDEPYHYKLVGDIIETDSGVVYRYSAHAELPATRDNIVYEGAEAFTIRDDLILTASDFYCDPDTTKLVEVSKLVSRRHGISRHADGGMSAFRQTRIGMRLSSFIEENLGKMDSSMTIAKVSGEIGCSPQQLLKVIDAKYGTRYSSGDGQPINALLIDLLPNT